MWHLYSMASASEDDEQLLKFFIYGRHVKGTLFCLELNIDKNRKKVGFITKAPAEGFARMVNAYISDFMRVNEFIKEE